MTLPAEDSRSRSPFRDPLKARARLRLAQGLA